jgi:hypothetical protein
MLKMVLLVHLGRCLLPLQCPPSCLTWQWRLSPPLQAHPHPASQLHYPPGYYLLLLLQLVLSPEPVLLLRLL